MPLAPIGAPERRDLLCDKCCARCTAGEYSCSRIDFNNVACAPDFWPAEIAELDVVRETWPARVALGSGIYRYGEIDVERTNNLQVMLVFKAQGHVLGTALAAKPMTQQAADGFLSINTNKTPWIRLNPDNVYINYIYRSGDSSPPGWAVNPDNPPQLQPLDWGVGGVAWAYDPGSAPNSDHNERSLGCARGDDGPNEGGRMGYSRPDESAFRRPPVRRRL